MAILNAKIWFGHDSIIVGRVKRGRGKVKLKIKKPDKYLWLNYEEGDFDNTVGEMRRKIEEATKGINPYGVLIY